MCDSVVGESALLALLSPGPSEMLLIAGVALLLFGGRLPEVARSWGKTFAEFRRGLTGIQSDLKDAIYHEPQKLEYQPESTSYSDDSYSDDSLYDTTETPTETPTENSVADLSDGDLSDGDVPEAEAAEEGQQEEAAPDDALSEGDSAAPKRD
jgi:sec-independent protein translocase protein TatA